MKTTTLKQALKIIEIFQDAPVEQMQAILESGLLTDLRYANIGQMEKSEVRNEVQVLLGLKPLKKAQHIINCDADPFIPEGWKVEEHRKGGSFAWNPSAIEFYLSDSQRKGRIEGNKLRKELADKPVLNANVLDYLLSNPHLIPESWKKDEHGNTRYIFFWGTIYRDPRGRRCVLCLCFGGGQWHWDYYWLNGGWYGHYPSAVLASN